MAKEAEVEAMAVRASVDASLAAEAAMQSGHSILTSSSKKAEVPTPVASEMPSMPRKAVAKKKKKGPGPRSSLMDAPSRDTSEEPGAGSGTAEREKPVFDPFEAGTEHPNPNPSNSISQPPPSFPALKS